MSDSHPPRIILNDTTTSTPSTSTSSPFNLTEITSGPLQTYAELLGGGLSAGGGGGTSPARASSPSPVPAPASESAPASEDNSRRNSSDDTILSSSVDFPSLPTLRGGIGSGSGGMSVSVSLNDLPGADDSGDGADDGRAVGFEVLAAESREDDDLYPTVDSAGNDNGIVNVGSDLSGITVDSETSKLTYTSSLSASSPSISSSAPTTSSSSSLLQPPTSTSSSSSTSISAISPDPALPSLPPPQTADLTPPYPTPAPAPASAASSAPDSPHVTFVPSLPPSPPPIHLNVNVNKPPTPQQSNQLDHTLIHTSSNLEKSLESISDNTPGDHFASRGDKITLIGDHDIVEKSPGNRYVRFNEKLGSGAYKDVFRAYDTIEGIEVAWNLVSLGGIPKSDKARIINEVRLLEKLNHSNIISFHGSWVNRDLEQVVFVTEILSSGTLKSFINKVKVVRWKIIKRWSLQILSGLLYLHSQDPPVIHRDLKCDNIFINGTSGDLRIGDLGLSTILSSTRSTKALSVLGTPEFMAPELYDESYDEKVDVYAFGMCILEMITKEIPYRECTNPAQIFKKVTNNIPPKLLSRVRDDGAKSFIRLCLESDPNKRPTTQQLMDHVFLKEDEGADDYEPVVDAVTTLTPIVEGVGVGVGLGGITAGNNAKRNALAGGGADASNNSNLNPNKQTRTPGGPQVVKGHGQNRSQGQAQARVVEQVSRSSTVTVSQISDLASLRVESQQSDDLIVIDASNSNSSSLGLTGRSRTPSFDAVAIPGADDGGAAMGNFGSSGHLNDEAGDGHGHGLGRVPPVLENVESVMGELDEASSSSADIDSTIDARHTGMTNSTLHEHDQDGSEARFDKARESSADYSNIINSMQESEVSMKKIKVMMGRELEISSPDSKIQVSSTSASASSSSASVGGASIVPPPVSASPSPASSALETFHQSQSFRSSSSDSQNTNRFADTHLGAEGSDYSPTFISASSLSNGEHSADSIPIISLDTNHPSNQPGFNPNVIDNAGGEHDPSILHLSLTMPVEGKTQQVQFDFHLVEDDPVSVAKEMVEELSVSMSDVNEISLTINRLALQARLEQAEKAEREGRDLRGRIVKDKAEAQVQVQAQAQQHIMQEEMAKAKQAQEQVQALAFMQQQKQVEMASKVAVGNANAGASVKGSAAAAAAAAAAGNVVDGGGGLNSSVYASGDDEDMKLEQDYQQKLQRARKAYQTRMENLHKSQVEKETLHRKVVDKHEKEMVEFEKKVKTAEIEQGKRLQLVEAEWGVARAERERKNRLIAIEKSNIKMVEDKLREDAVRKQMQVVSQQQVYGQQQARSQQQLYYEHQMAVQKSASHASNSNLSALDTTNLNVIPNDDSDVTGSGSNNEQTEEHGRFNVVVPPSDLSLNLNGNGSMSPGGNHYINGNGDVNANGNGGGGVKGDGDILLDSKCANGSGGEGGVNYSVNGNVKGDNSESLSS